MLNPFKELFNKTPRLFTSAATVITIRIRRSFISPSRKIMVLKISSMKND